MGQEWQRGRICWVGFELSLLYPSSDSSIFLYACLSTVGFEFSLLYRNLDSSIPGFELSFLYASLDSFYACSNTVQDKLKGEREEGTV